MAENRRRSYSDLMQILIWLCIFLAFTAALFFLGSGLSARDAFKASAGSLFVPFLIYIANYYLLVPKLFFNDHRVRFVVINIVVTVSVILLPVVISSPVEAFKKAELHEYLQGFSVWKFLIGVILIRLLLYGAMVVLAIGMRYIIRWYDERKNLEEERRRNTEAELNWLKNQLNPHFLFNTLNNISSLVHTDAEKAQDSIAQLSDLLRYALYESNNPKVRIVDEVAFMKSYIALMTLRCSRKTAVKVHFDEFDTSLQIPPLLFISLVENAFKHGTSAHYDAFVKIDMVMDGTDLVFSCENTLLPKETKDYSGSGVGLENLRRRLELIYPGGYSYEDSIGQGSYVAKVRIMNVKCHE